MPFQYNIETVTDNVDVSLEVFNNTITIYFDSDSSTEGKLYQDIWELIHKQFLSSLARYNPNPVSVTDNIHIKKSHVSESDAERCHIHIEFLRKVHPSMLQEYLKKFKIIDSSLEPANRLLADEEFFNSLIESYTSAYHDTAFHTHEEKLKNTKKLTKEESRDYLNFLLENNTPVKKTSDKYDTLELNELICFTKLGNKRKNSYLFFDKNCLSENKTLSSTKKIKKP